MQKCDGCHKPAWACAECLKEVEPPSTPSELIQQARELCDAATPVLVAEKECVQKNIAGCNRDCGKCDLALPEDAIIAGFNAAIAVVGGCVPALIDQADQLVSENAALNSEFMHEKSVGVQDALDNAEVISFLKARAETAESELEQLRGVCDDLKIYGEKYVKIAEKRYEAFERAYARAEKAAAERDTYKAALEALHIPPELLALKAGDHR